MYQIQATHGCIQWPSTRLCVWQAGPSDPESFPFVVLGNKVDMDEGKNRQVGSLSNPETPVTTVSC